MDGEASSLVWAFVSKFDGITFEFERAGNLGGSGSASFIAMFELERAGSLGGKGSSVSTSTLEIERTGSLGGVGSPSMLTAPEFERTGRGGRAPPPSAFMISYDTDDCLDDVLMCTTVKTTLI